MSCVLALDTSGRSAQVALARDGRVLAQAAHDAGGSYAESLLPLLDRALQSAGLRAQDVTAIAVVEGPGSFTGLRIGIMTAKTLSFASGAQLLSATALQLLASTAAAAAHGGAPCRTLVALADAGRGHGFAGVFAVSALAATPEGQPKRVSYDGLGQWLRALPGPVTIAASAPDSLEAARRAAAQTVGTLVIPVGSLAAELAGAASRGADFVRRADRAALVPAYLSASQAERARGLDVGDEVHRPAPVRPAGERS